MNKHSNRKSLELAMTYSHFGKLGISSLGQVQLVDFVHETLSNPQIATAWREQIVAETCGFIHSGKRFGPDAYTTGGEPVEIKTESTYNYAKGALKKLSGNGVFSSLTLDTITSQTDKHVIAGFHCGILVYVIEFPFHGEFGRSMERILETKSKLTVVKFNNTDWRDLPDLKLIYYSDDCDVLKVDHISDIMTSELLAVIYRLSYK